MPLMVTGATALLEPVIVDAERMQHVCCEPGFFFELSCCRCRYVFAGLDGAAGDLQFDRRKIRLVKTSRWRSRTA